MRINRKNLPEYRDRIVAALNAEFADEGFTIESGAIKYSDTDFNISLKVLAVPKEEIELEEWMQYCTLLGFTADDYGREFTNGGRTFRVSSISLNRPKYPIGAVCVEDGKKYKFQAEGLLAKFGRKEKGALGDFV